MHLSGLPDGSGQHACTTCAWAEPAAHGVRCLAARPEPMLLPPGTSGCAWWEPPVDCGSCGACCREAFDAVPVEVGGPVHRTHPSLVQTASDGWQSLSRMPSPSGCGTWCAALIGEGTRQAPYRCRIYASRPSACRDLEPGSANCLLARRRIGLSPGPAEGPGRPRTARPEVGTL